METQEGNLKENLLLIAIFILEYITREQTTNEQRQRKLSSKTNPR